MSKMLNRELKHFVVKGIASKRTQKSRLVQVKKSIQDPEKKASNNVRKPATRMRKSIRKVTENVRNEKLQ